MIAIIDYGAGNLRSVVNAISKLGYPSQIVSTPEGVLEAEAVILPGVGAAADTVASLQRLGWSARCNSILLRIDLSWVSASACKSYSPVLKRAAGTSASESSPG